MYCTICFRPSAPMQRGRCFCRHSVHLMQLAVYTMKVRQMNALLPIIVFYCAPCVDSFPQSGISHFDVKSAVCYIAQLFDLVIPCRQYVVCNVPLPKYRSSIKCVAPKREDFGKYSPGVILFQFERIGHLMIQRQIDWHICICFF